MSWIKMRRDLRHDTKVIAMARALAGHSAFVRWLSAAHHDAVTDASHVTENVTNAVTAHVVTRVTVTGLMDVWASLNETLREDGIAPHMVLHDLDAISEIPTFGVAMETVGWVIALDGGGLQFPNFYENNTPSRTRGEAKTAAERAKEYRERKKAEKESHESSRNRHVTSRDENHVEKRREEKSTHTAPTSLCVSRTQRDGEPPTQAELDAMKQPTTDELDLARFDAAKVFCERTQITWPQLVVLAERAEPEKRWTADSIAKAYVSAAAQQDFRVWHANGRGAPISAISAQSDLTMFVRNRAAKKPEAYGLRRRDGLDANGTVGLLPSQQPRIFRSAEDLKRAQELLNEPEPEH
jgi:hypothetical protein